MNTANAQSLALAVISLALQNRVEKLRFASPAVLGDFTPTASKCHDNARLFCEANPGYTVVGGWIVQSYNASGTFLIRHSVVSDAQGVLICVTVTDPEQHASAEPFVRHDPKWGRFDDFGSHIIFAAGIGVLVS